MIEQFMVIHVYVSDARYHFRKIVVTQCFEKSMSAQGIKCLMSTFDSDLSWRKNQFNDRTGRGGQIHGTQIMHAINHQATPDTERDPQGIRDCSFSCSTKLQGRCLLSSCGPMISSQARAHALGAPGMAQIKVWFARPAIALDCMVDVPMLANDRFRKSSP
jgi:hypothetical protein